MENKEIEFVSNYKLLELTSKTIKNVRLWWIKRVQRDSDIEKDREQLNLQENDQEVLPCHGRIQGENPVYLPNTSTFTEKLVQEAHLRALHESD